MPSTINAIRQSRMRYLSPTSAYIVPNIIATQKVTSMATDVSMKAKYVASTTWNTSRSAMVKLVSCQTTKLPTSTGNACTMSR